MGLLWVLVMMLEKNVGVVLVEKFILLKNRSVEMPVNKRKYMKKDPCRQETIGEEHIMVIQICYNSILLMFVRWCLRNV